MRGVGTGLTPKKKARFLSELADCPNVTAIGDKLRVSRTTLYREREADPEFAEQWDKARAIGLEAAEDEAWRRAIEGVDEPVFYQGSTCGAIKRYSDTLLIFMLKGGKPEKYRDRMDLGSDPKRPLLTRKVDECTTDELMAIAAGGIVERK